MNIGFCRGRTRYICRYKPLRGASGLRDRDHGTTGLTATSLGTLGFVEVAPATFAATSRYGALRGCGTGTTGPLDYRTTGLRHELGKYLGGFMRFYPGLAGAAGVGV